MDKTELPRGENHQPIKVLNLKKIGGSRSMRCRGTLEPGKNFVGGTKFARCAKGGGPAGVTGGGCNA